MRDPGKEFSLIFTHAPNVIIVAMQISAAGDRALMLTMPGASAARLRAIAEAAQAIDGVLAAIVGEESVYVIGTRDRAALQSIAERAADQTSGAATRHDIDVSFAPEYALDFADLAARAGEPADAIIARIAALTLTVRYLGFIAGWAYLEGWPEEWALPRRATSRNRVPGGSFAIANTMAGFYPIDSPGGWNILGRTDAVPRFRPGDEVRIVPVDRPIAFVPPKAAVDSLPVDIIAPGQMTTVVRARDWSRLEEGEPAGGAFDEVAAAIANRAAGNPEGAALFECVLVGPRFRVRNAGRVAWCGASLEPRVWNVRAGEEIDIGRIRDGFRGYVAVECGGLPRPSVGKASASRRTPKELRIIRGPHDAPPFPVEWEVTPQMNRVGIRLRPVRPHDVRPPAELPSCGMQFGTLQWHPDGSIVAMGPDHPVTGGYLQPATIIAGDLWKLGQLAPGDRIRLLE